MAVRIVFHNAGFVELLNCPEVLADLDRRARAIAEAAGDGMTATPAERGRRRAHASVWTETFPARIAEAQDRALTRAIDAGRA